jgi:3-deoxy-D-manno-octulosonic acid (KDO) 8-phosphate synthase
MSLYGWMEHRAGPVVATNRGWLFAYDTLVIIPHLYYSIFRFICGASTAWQQPGTAVSRRGGQKAKIALWAARGGNRPGKKINIWQGYA